MHRNLERRGSTFQVKSKYPTVGGLEGDSVLRSLRFKYNSGGGSEFDFLSLSAHISTHCWKTSIKKDMLLRRSIVNGLGNASSSSSSALVCLPPLLADFLGGQLQLHSSSVVPKEARAMAQFHEAGNVKGSDEVVQEKELGKLASPIMPHIFNLYGLKATAVDYEIYTPDATFEDPLMRAKGVKQIKSAFYSMPKIFSEGQISEYDVKETETAPGSGEILIDNVQHYKVFGKAIDMKSLIKLQVENGKVTRHEDLWDKKPLWNKDTVRVPLVGRTTEYWRRFNMLVTHGLMGCGKDPKPKN